MSEVSTASLMSRVADVLDEWNAPHGPLHPDGCFATVNAFGASVLTQRSDRALEQLLASTSPGARHRIARVVAGPPGSGKSAYAHGALAELPARHIDPDSVKSALLSFPETTTLFDGLLGRTISNGERLKLREMSSLVHHEANRVVKRVTNECISRRENVLIEGTFWIRSKAEDLLKRLHAGEYQLQIIRCYVDEAEAIRRTQARWWRGRALDQGERYISRRYIHGMYSNGRYLSAFA